MKKGSDDGSGLDNSNPLEHLEKSGEGYENKDELNENSQHSEGIEIKDDEYNEPEIDLEREEMENDYELMKSLNNLKERNKKLESVNKYQKIKLESLESELDKALTQIKLKDAEIEDLKNSNPGKLAQNKTASYVAQINNLNLQVDKYKALVNDKKIEYNTLLDKYNEIQNEELPLALVIEGKGQGIFENDHQTLWQYLAGEIDPESNKEDIDEGPNLPMNMEFKKYGDFENPLDLEDMIYYEDDISDLMMHQDPNYMNEINHLIRTISAYEIFNNEKVNKEFKRLLKTHNLNNAYEMVVNSVTDLFISEELDENNYDEVFTQCIKKLK